MEKQVKQGDEILWKGNGLFWVTEVDGPRVLVGCIGITFRLKDLAPHGEGKWISENAYSE